MRHFFGTFVAFFACFSLPAFAVEGTPVRLGSDSLTNGIPGSGTLKLVEVEAWLAKSDNHKTLEVELPPALQVGKSQVYIPADNPLTLAKIELGRQLYFDKRFSKNAEVSCADCHHPNFGYAKNTQFGVGVAGQTGNPNLSDKIKKFEATAQDKADLVEFMKALTGSLPKVEMARLPE